MSLDQLLQAADSALYRAKDAGRDRVVSSAASGVAL
jgi:PleD family two-component response regulator